MTHSSFKNILWWTLWGLALGGGLFCLKESFRDSRWLLAAMPLLSGSAAAAVSRLNAEYHKAAAQVKWLALSAPVALLGFAFLYIRAGAYGPFATGGSQRAFLNVTFGMSVPEVERALDRHLVPMDSPKEVPSLVNEWLTEFVVPGRHAQAMYLLPNLELFGVSCQAHLEFLEGRLGRVQLEFPKISHETTPILAARLREELRKEYRSGRNNMPDQALFQKDNVEVQLNQTAPDPLTNALEVELSDLALLHRNPLRADSHVF